MTVQHYRYLLAPLVRKYYFMTSYLAKEERKKWIELFGNFTVVIKPVKPYKKKLKDGKELLEIPVTTMPVFLTLYHLSQLIY